MKNHLSGTIKTVALLGHGNSGKTTLAEAVLFCGKATERIGKTDDAAAVMDFDAEEKKRKVSLSASVYPVEFGENKINLIDAPGLFDFEGEVSEAVAAADTAVIVVSGKSGLSVGATKAFDRAKKNKKAIAFFVGKLDSPHAHFYRVISALTGKYGSVVCPVVVPVVENDVATAYVNLIENKAYAFDGINKKEINFQPTEDVTKMRDIMLEAVASTDEALMEKYFEGEAFTEAEITEALKKGMLSGDICPVFCGAQLSGDGVPLFTDILFSVAPAANEGFVSLADGENVKFANPDESGEPALFVFKTIADPFVGKLSYFKVISGKIKGDMKLKNFRTGEDERLTKTMYIKAGKQEDAPEVVAGDIGCMSKLGDVKTGDTLSQSGKISIADMDFPRPCLSVAVYPKNKGDEEKIAQGINRLLDEDPTIAFSVDKETKESILSGLGEQHIDVIVSRLKSKFGVDVELKSPQVAYRETIRKSAKVQGRYKKQSGGHGQFGDVWIEFEPTDSEELVFEEKVFGGAVPKNFFPAVEKGLRDSVTKGVLAGFPMVGVKATLVDGSYHPVDSSEMSFKTAASLAFKEGIPQCSPVLLEPYGTLKAHVPDENLGDVIADINKRRGRIIGMNPENDGMQEVVGEVPFAEMSDFATAMRSIAAGRATFTLTFERYEDVPASIAAKVIEEHKVQE